MYVKEVIRDNYIDNYHVVYETDSEDCDENEEKLTS